MNRIYEETSFYIKNLNQALSNNDFFTSSTIVTALVLRVLSYQIFPVKRSAIAVYTGVPISLIGIALRNLVKDDLIKKDNEAKYSVCQETIDLGNKVVFLSASKHLNEIKLADSR